MVGSQDTESIGIQPGSLINEKYELLEFIGSGAYGTVFKAIQHPVGRVVALKFISRHLGSDPENRSRFFHEAQALARLNHPSVVTMYDYGESNGHLFLVMEYIEGEELTQLVQVSAPLNPVRVMNIGQQILRALVEAHEVGLVHRDLKPANIMLTKDSTGEERVKVLDFGIASLRTDGHGPTGFQRPRALGTPGYCSPEQCLGQVVRPSADLYAVGIILYELLTGKAPFSGPNTWMLIDRHLNEPVPIMAKDLLVPPGLESTVRLALAKKPDARFPDARSMLRRMLELISDTAITAESSMPTVRDLPILDMQAVRDISRRLDGSAMTDDTDLKPSSNTIFSDPPDVRDSRLEPDPPAPNHGSRLEPEPPAPNHGKLESRWGLTPLALTVTVNSVILLAIGLMVTVFSNYA